MPDTTDINKDEITIEAEGDTFVFKIPSIREEAKMASIIQAMILEDCGNTQVNEESLSPIAIANYRTIASFEVLLKRSTAAWVWDKSDGKVTLSKNLGSKALEIYVQLVQKLQEFFRNQSSNNDPTSKATVESKQGTGG